MGDPVQKFLIFLFFFSSASLLVWAGSRLVQEGLKEYEKHYMSATSQALAEMFVFQDPRQLLLFNVILTIILMFLALLFTRNVVYILLFGSLGFAAPKLVIQRIRKRRLDRFALQLGDGLTMLSNGLRSGMNLAQSIEILESEMTPPISQEFGLVIRETKLGVPLNEALKNLAGRIPNDDLQLIIASVNIVLGLGGNLTEIFDSMSNIIRERGKIEEKTKALTAQGKLQGLVVGLLPTFLAVVMYFMDPLLMERMFTTPIGNIATATMITMQIIGYILIRKVTTIEI
ncbi:MAG: hypothetical protein GY868_06270 [Deltaproteobacteria bacterium]|nr:hypothetical protein [Deltaproteobacteria bacterium]